MATAFTRGAASKMSSGSLLRMMMPSASFARRRIVSGALSGARTTSVLLERSASPSAAIGSISNTLFTVVPLCRTGASIPETRILSFDQAQQAAPFELADAPALAGLIPFVCNGYFFFFRKVHFCVGCQRKGLGLAGAVEPVHRHKSLRNRAPHREKPVVAQDHRLVLAQIGDEPFLL